MKLLILTQKIDQNDGVLSFMIGWIKAFAENCEHVTVIALTVGEHDLPANVTVYSLGKEHRESRFLYLNFFYHYIWKERKNYDSVFVHMNTVYVILGGLFWRVFGKRVVLWYAHGRVSWDLYLATYFSHVILTSSPSGYRITTPKRAIVGQGINTELFSFHERAIDEHAPLRLCIIGRISPTKDYETLLHAFAILVNEKGMRLQLDIVGGAGAPDQEPYVEHIQQLGRELGVDMFVTFHGPKPHHETVTYLHDSAIFVSTATNGSFDKAMGDAMSTGLPVVACNDAMREVFGALSLQLMFPKGDSEALVRILTPLILMSQHERNKLGRKMRELIEREHSLSTFIGKIMPYFSSK